MPTSFGLERLHLHCIRVHNSGLQIPTSSMCKSTTHSCVLQEDTSASTCMRQETRASHLHASKRCVHRYLTRTLDDVCAHRRAQRSARPPAPHTEKMCASGQLQGSRPTLTAPVFSAMFSPRSGRM